MAFRVNFITNVTRVTIWKFRKHYEMFSDLDREMYQTVLAKLDITYKIYNTAFHRNDQLQMKDTSTFYMLPPTSHTTGNYLGSVSI